MSSEKKLLVVLGVTGIQGGSVAKVFSELEPQWRVRGITRNPDSSSARALKPYGIELVAGNMDDTASLEAAFQGADAIFSVTDFWQFLKPDQSTFAESAAKGIPPNRIAMEKEYQQGVNIIDAAAKAHAEKPLQRFVLSTLSDSEKWSNGKIKNNLHFDGKAKYTAYLKTQHPDLAAVSNYLQIGYYLSNAFTIPQWGPRKTGEKEYVIPSGTIPNGKPIPYLDPGNDTGHFVRALVTSPKSPPGTVMLGYAKNIPFEEYATLWGSTLGVKVQKEPLTLEAMLNTGSPEWLAAEVDESAHYISTFGWEGGEPNVKSPEEGGVDVSKLTDMATWIRAQDWSGIGIENQAQS